MKRNLEEPEVVALEYCLGARMALPTQVTSVAQGGKDLDEGSTVGTGTAGVYGTPHVIGRKHGPPPSVCQSVALVASVVRKMGAAGRF